MNEYTVCHQVTPQCSSSVKVLMSSLLAVAFYASHVSERKYLMKMCNYIIGRTRGDW